MAGQYERIKPRLKSNMHSSRHVIIIILSSQLRIRLHQCLFAEGLLDLHPRLSIHIDT
jgi:hypothetical protein